MADRTVRVRLEAITSQFQAGLAKAGAETKLLETRFSGFQKQMKNADLSASGMFKTLANLSAGELAAGAGAAIAGAAIVKMAKDGIKHYIELATEVRGYMRVTGESAEQSSVMIARAHALGISTESLGLAMFRMSRNIESNRDELAQLGVHAVRTASGQVDLGRTLDAVRDAYMRAGKGAEGNRISQLALSRGAITLLPLLGATRDRLDEIDKVARRTHQILGDKDVQNVLQYKIATHELHAELDSFGIALAQNVLPKLTELVDAVSKTLGLVERTANTDIPLPHRGKDSVTVGDVAKSALQQLPGIGGFFIDEEKHASAANKAAEAEAKLNVQLEVNQQAVQEYSSSLDSLYASFFAVTESQDKFEVDLAAFNTTVLEAKANGNQFATSLDDTTTSGLQNRAMMRGLIGDIDAIAKKYKEQHPDATQEEINQAIRRQVLQLKNVATALGLDKAKADALFASLASIAGLDLSKPGKTYSLGWGVHINNPFAGSGAGSTAPPTDTSTKPDKTSSADYLQALWQQRMEQVKNRFHAGQATLAEYERSLDEQLAKEKPWTDQWVTLQQEKADAVHYWTNAAANYLQALATQQASIEDNMFQVGALAKDKYLDILRQRLAGLQQYSDEWTRIYQQIKQLEGDTLESELAIIEAVEKQRQFDIAFYGAAQQRAMYSSLTPVTSSGTTTIYNTKSASYELNAYGADSRQASSTNLQKLRDLAVAG